MSSYLDQIVGIYAPDVPMVRAALTAIVERTRAQALADARQGIENAADKRPSLMNPDTMRHIAANVELWADHAKCLREPSAQGETAPAPGDERCCCEKHRGWHSSRCTQCPMHGTAVASAASPLPAAEGLEQLRERITAWREDDAQGYDAAIDLLGEIETALLRAVAEGRK